LQPRGLAQHAHNLVAWWPALQVVQAATRVGPPGLLAWGQVSRPLLGGNPHQRSPQHPKWLGMQLLGQVKMARDRFGNSVVVHSPHSQQALHWIFTRYEARHCHILK